MIDIFILNLSPYAERTTLERARALLPVVRPYIKSNVYQDFCETVLEVRFLCEPCSEAILA